VVVGKKGVAARAPLDAAQPRTRSHGTAATVATPPVGARRGAPPPTARHHPMPSSLTRHSSPATDTRVGSYAHT
jgi:hypothetical protein